MWMIFMGCPQEKFHMLEALRVYFRHFYYVTEVATNKL